MGVTRYDVRIPFKNMSAKSNLTILPTDPLDIVALKKVGFASWAEYEANAEAKLRKYGYRSWAEKNKADDKAHLATRGNYSSWAEYNKRNYC